MNTEIILLTDRSGSMSSIDKAACAGINSFISDQQNVPGDARVTHVLFDDHYQVPIVSQPIDTWMTLRTVGPRGMTALRDALGRTIEEQGKRIRREGWADLVVVCVTTDGQENHSRKYSPEDVRRLVSQATEAGWQFVFLAANQNAVVVGQSYGFKAEQSFNFDATAEGTTRGYSTMSSTTTSLRGTCL